MRYALAALAFLVSPASAAPMTPSECAEAAKLFSSASETMDNFASSTLPKGVIDPTIASTPEFRLAAIRAEDARRKLVPAAKEYAQTLEDLAYQLKVCARR
ncbi:hypothetical protein MKK58_13700 [Methylobacterium sp. J-078]|uniref:hypothetical protein n=1 Tax=Methylobacterium sp. J-078 TaxID=2836657 RepID=UPI001FB9532F|nr:hypothetical protein [Methylobacterium sp. J-078]MCJ2045579.1 hypothetical protein [Methylobacterium sp. J-078]